MKCANVIDNCCNNLNNFNSEQERTFRNSNLVSLFSPKVSFPFAASLFISTGRSTCGDCTALL